MSLQSGDVDELLLSQNENRKRDSKRSQKDKEEVMNKSTFTDFQEWIKNNK